MSEIHTDTQKYNDFIKNMLKLIYFKINNNQNDGIILLKFIPIYINMMNIDNKIQLNRIYAKYGILEFKKGSYDSCYKFLKGLIQYGKEKILLAQGVRFNFNRDDKTRKNDERLILPMHLHINIKLLHFCYYLSLIFKISEDSRDDDVIKSKFLKYIHFYKNKIFKSPPENLKDTIVECFLNIKEGNFKEAIKLLIDSNCLNYFPKSERETIKNSIFLKIKKLSLENYLINSDSFYNNVKIEYLSKIFKLEFNIVHSLISKMISQNKISAKINQIENSLVFNESKDTRLHKLSLELIEKIENISNLNKIFLDNRKFVR